MSSSIVITGTPPHSRGGAELRKSGLARSLHPTRLVPSNPPSGSQLALPGGSARVATVARVPARCRPTTECLPPMLLAGSGRGGGKLTKSKLNIICCRNHSLEVCNSHRAVGGPTRWSQSDAMACYCHPDFIDWPRSCYQQASRVCSGRSRLQSPPAHSILLSGPRPLWRSVELWRHAPLWVLPFA